MCYIEEVEVNKKGRIIFGALSSAIITVIVVVSGLLVALWLMIMAIIFKRFKGNYLLSHI